MGLRLGYAREKHLLLVRRAHHRLPRGRRRLHRQYVDRLGAALLGRIGPQALHQQRRQPCRRVPCRRLPRRPDDVAAFLCGASRQRSAGQQCPELRREIPPEWTRTMRLVRPNVFLIAEDHSGWPAVTQSSEAGGLGFDATWFAEYYHQLIGDATNDPSRARLLKFAGYGDDRALNVSWFAGTLANTVSGRVVYHESHDEAGNSQYQEGGQDVYSARTIVVAVNSADLVGATRRYAEARVRFAAGMTLLGPGTPMFFMGEEVGAANPYRYSDFVNFREDFPGLRAGAGANLFRYYQDLIRLRLSYPALRAHMIDIAHVHDANRVLAFRRRDGAQEILVMGSLNNNAFTAGYCIQNASITDGRWREIFNGDAAAYGGSGLTNAGTIESADGSFTAALPANSVVVFLRRICSTRSSDSQVAA